MTSVNVLSLLDIEFVDLHLSPLIHRIAVLLKYEHTVNINSKSESKEKPKNKPINPPTSDIKFWSL